MHNALNRLQTTFGFFTSCAFTLAAIIAFLSVIPLPAPAGSPSASVAVSNAQVVMGRPHYYSTKREEYAQIRFDLDADLTSLFTWNTKQVFVYLTTNYPSGPDGGSSEAVIWDLIIPASTSPYSFSNLKARYWDPRMNKKTMKSSKARTKKTSSDKKSTTDLTKPEIISLKNQKPKYQITDPSGILSDRSNATLQLSWNIQPWVGALIWDKGYLGSRVGAWDSEKVGQSRIFSFPSIKSKTEVVKDKEGPKTPAAGSATPALEV